VSRVALCGAGVKLELESSRVACGEVEVGNEFFAASQNSQQTATARAMRASAVVSLVLFVSTPPPGTNVEHFSVVRSSGLLVYV